MPIMLKTANEIKHNLRQDLRVHYHADKYEARLAPMELLNLEELHRDALLYIEQLESNNRELAQLCDRQSFEFSAATRQNTEQKLWFMNTLQSYISRLPSIPDTVTVVPYTLEQLLCRYDDDADNDECYGLAVVMETRDGFVSWAILDRYDGGLQAIWNAQADGNFTEDTYGTNWRCWPRKPTDEERKAAKWDG